MENSRWQEWARRKEKLNQKCPQQKPFAQQIGSIWMYLLSCGCASVCVSMYIRLVVSDERNECFDFICEKSAHFHHSLEWCIYRSFSLYFSQTDSFADPFTLHSPFERHADKCVRHRFNVCMCVIENRVCSKIQNPHTTHFMCETLCLVYSHNLSAERFSLWLIAERFERTHF